MSDHPTYHGALPNLLIIGVFKAGTTSLFHYLQQHPDIYGAPKKETHFFSPLVYGQGETQPMAAYADYFRAGESARYRLEATPSYLYGGAALSGLFRQHLPADARCIVVLREPADRLLSYFRYIKTRFQIPENESLSDFLDKAEAEDSAAAQLRVGIYANALKEGRYAQYLPAWQAAYGDRLRVVFFDELAANPRHLMRGLAAWLDLDPAPYEAYQYAVENQTVAPHNKGLHRLALAVNTGLEGFFRKNEALKRRLREWYMRLNVSSGQREFAEAELARLRAHYVRPNAELAAWLRAKDPAIVLPDWLQNA